MLPLKRLCRIAAVFVLASGGVCPACGQPVTEPTEIIFDVSEPRQELLGFGAQTWPGDMRAETVLESLGMRFVRMTVGPNWPNVDAKPPTDATREAMDTFLAKHFDGDNEPRLANAKRSWAMTDRLGIQVVMIQFTAPENWLSDDGQRRLLPDHLDDYAVYWGSLVAYMDSHGMRPPYIELSNEPEGDWNTRILPDAYNKLAILTRKELDERGFEDIKIVGPGLAWLDHDNGGQRWVGALTEEGMNALAAWSTHVWDEKFQVDAPPGFVPARWRDFKAAIQRKDPAGEKPIFVTEYATGATTFHGVAYDPVESSGNNRASNSYAYAQRVFEQTLQHVNQGASVLIVWEAADQPWSGHAWGLVTGLRARPVFDALKTLLPVVPRDAVALQPQDSDGRVTSAGFMAKDRLVIAMANGTDTVQTRTLIIKNAGGLVCIDATRYHQGKVDHASLVINGNRVTVALKPMSTLTCHFQLVPVDFQKAE